MRAVLVEQFSPVQSLRIQDVPSPDASQGQVRVRVKAVGIGFVDGLKIEGLYQTKDPIPFVPGMEFSGVVDQVGEGVSQMVVGDRVFGLARRGALAEQILMSASELHRMPVHLSFAQAAAIPVNYLTAAYGLKHRAALRAGELLLILGAAGGTGTAAIKIGKMLGAQVIAAASTEEKRSFACAQGADAAIDYTREGWREGSSLSWRCRCRLRRGRWRNFADRVPHVRLAGQAPCRRLCYGKNPCPSVQHRPLEGSLTDGSRQRPNSEMGAGRVRSSYG